MKIVKNIEVPTGNIMLVTGNKGMLECLSLGDYGKDHNIVADFMGLDRKLDKVEHTALMPLEEKWVITISTQYGCMMGCTFCDVPKVQFRGNATFDDLIGQVKAGLSLHPEVAHANRINLHFARMGEPTFNRNVLEATMYVAGFLKEKGWGFHPVVSTMMPRRNDDLASFIRSWMNIKNNILKGEAGLQLSINSTSNVEREKMFSGSAMPLQNIANFMSLFDVVGRKITLNFAVAEYEIDAKKLASLFSPDKFLVKLTPMHKTTAALTNGIKTDGDYTTYYPYQEHEKNLKAEGFDVLTFIASAEEDDSCITCGNALLGGSTIKSDSREIDLGE